ncbi:pentatricopeptide repeat-containing protein, chloroplastic [Iris pallida]|uniref:Pentatricopeptide repeat-containing protein, chloroplastic n=1 Tax=Iris pallida TaxID=29817 RepID=A0AAX6GL74_IRIPA|nr:pentatricopeptide repeat-containing protein, chloroplastic [Iris pallida]
MVHLQLLQFSSSSSHCAVCYNLWGSSRGESFGLKKTVLSRKKIGKHIPAAAHGSHSTAELAVEGPVEGENTARKSERRIWKRVAAMSKSARTKQVPGPVPSRCVQPSHGSEDDVGVFVSSVKAEASMEHCNSILKLLEKQNDSRTMEFFDWMKSNGKLEKNDTAYNLALRALARRENWAEAESLLREMTFDSGCELTPRVFNALIFVCAKRGLVACGEKWFRMMLQEGVKPNVATVGMLMGLYQKNGNLAQAEFTFAHMRSCKLQCVTAYSAMITMYTRLGLYDKSEEIIRLMEEDGAIPNLENWLVRLNVYSQQGKVEVAELVLRSMLSSGIPPNIIAYNILIMGYGKVSNPKAAHRLFENLQTIGLDPDETTYRSMVEGFGRADSYKEAMWYYKELKNSGFKPSSSNFYTMINLQARHADEKGVVQTLKDMRLVGCQYSSILSSLLQAYERVGGMEKVPLILKASFYENILCDPTSCSILVMAYVQNSLVDEAMLVLQEKTWEDSNFEDNLYHLLICSCKEAGHLDNAVKIYNQMPQSENINLHISCSMIDILSSLHRFSEAENLYKKLKALAVAFDMIAYSIVVRMYIKSGSLKDACLVLEMMENQKDIVPDTFLFRDMLRTYQQCGKLEKLASLYYRLLKSGVTWDEAMYNCVINCCGRALPVDEVSRLFNEMIQCGYAANTITFNVMLHIYGKSGFLRKARKVFLMARKQGLADVISYNTIIAAYSHSRDFKKMRSTVQQMQHEGYPVSLEVYNCMLDAYGKEDLFEEFNGVLQKMKEARCSSDHYTYNILINIYAKKGWIEEVSHVLGKLKEHGLEPDLYSYNTLIKAYGIAGMVEEAVNVVQEMRVKGIQPDRITFGNLVTALQRNENFLEAVKWSLWMKQMTLLS